MPIKVLVVDDSAVIRRILGEMIDRQPDLTVVGFAADPFAARDQIKKLNPDVLTLDIEMPRMDGVTFLRNLMRLRPMPVIMISTLTEASADITLEALNIGAFDFVTKPKPDQNASLADYETEIIEKIRGAAGANLGRLEFCSQQSQVSHAKSVKGSYKPRSNTIITIGASTGGTEAIKDVLMSLPPNFPPVVVAQHIPPQFSTSYAQRLNRICNLTVLEAQNNQKLESGIVYVAPGDRHLAIVKKTNGLMTEILATDKVNRHRPSVEVLFDSVRELNIKHTIGVLLTGMGADGSAALLRLKQAGAYTIIQDEKSSVVWGMPGTAFNLEAHCEMLALAAIPKKLITLTNVGV